MKQMTDFTQKKKLEKNGLDKLLNKYNKPR